MDLKVKTRFKLYEDSVWHIAGAQLMHGNK